MRNQWLLWSFIYLSACEQAMEPAGEHQIPSPRFQHMMVYDEAREEVLLVGGFNGGSARVTDHMWRWDGDVWSEVHPTDPEGDGDPWDGGEYGSMEELEASVEERRSHAMAYDSDREVVVLFGGIRDSLISQDTWEWNGSSWTHILPTDPEGDGHPEPVINHQMVYDQARGVTLLVGGQGNDYQTWAYDGSSWALETDWRNYESAPNLYPDGRFWHTLAYDPIRETTILFGGLSEYGSFHSTLWEYDGRNWVRGDMGVGDGERPEPVGETVMVYDEMREKMVVFSGFQPNSTHSDKTWNWDGERWSLAASGASDTLQPAPRNSHGMAYDAARQECVLFGGFGGQTNQETWTWNGEEWTRR